MKLIQKSIAILVLAITATLMVNCSSSSSSGDSGETTFYLKCKINGVQFTCTDPMVGNSLSKAITAISDNNDTHQETVSLWMPLGVTVGTHTITEEPSNVNSYGAGYSDFDNSISSQDASGSMTITEVNANVIKGTFSFTSPDGDGNTITVTEGTFRAENIQ
ncbi:DUF6252 family protein [Flavobacterium sp. XGLA_31]|uniref:DUF6252 family protein n=1 Tax=Flavobacterium sp. XGLA_31 TaxID=3447666 RepID=UPI003F3AD585